MSLSVSLIGVGALQTVIYLLFIRAVDLYERESFRYVIPVFVWGFTGAALIALVFNELFAFALSVVAGSQVTTFLTAVVGAPIIEECAKGLALLTTFAVAYLVSRRRGAIEFSGVMDGIVYGSAVGFGFSLIEDVLYYAQLGPEAYAVRRVFGGFAHAAFTSLTGVGIGLIPWVRSWFLKVLLPTLGLIGAILLHATFNLAATLFGPLAYLVMFFVILAYVLLIFVWLAIERRIIREELREELAAGVITPEEYAILPTYFLKTGYYLGLLFSGDLLTWRLARRAHATAVDLALTKRLARRSYTPYGDPNVEFLRRRLLGIKATAPRPGS